MSNYNEWKDESGRIMVQVYDECDLPVIQKLYIERGYYITGIIYASSDFYFFTVDSVDYEENEK